MNKSIECPVLQHARSIPDNISLTDGSVSLSYSELDRKIDAILYSLRQRGIDSGDKLAVLAKNSTSYAVTILSCFRHGLCVVPLNYRMNPDWWRESIRVADCRLLLLDEDYAHVSEKVTIPSVNLLSIMSTEKTHPTVHSAGIDLDRIFSIMFTSGSTGRPRGVMLTSGNHYYNAIASNENIRLSQGDCWLAVLPFCHVGGMAILFRSMLAGSSVRVMSHFDADNINRLIDDGSISHISVVPAMLDSIIEARQDRDFPPTLKAVLLGGAPTSRRLVEKACALKTPLFTTYGMTEAASQICTTSPGDSGDRLLTSGKPLGNCEIRIVSSDNDILEYGKEGEIQIRGKSVFTAYLNEDQNRTFLPDGWFKTGDIGLFDNDGYLHVPGRKDALFVSGGENIHPSAIERITADFPGIEECAVIAVDDEKWGARPVLFVQPIGAGISIVELNTYLETHLSQLLMPKAIIIIEEMPGTTLGKIDTHALLEIYLSTEESDTQSGR